MAGCLSEEGAHSIMPVALEAGDGSRGGDPQAKGQDLWAWDQEGGKWPNDVATWIGGWWLLCFSNGCSDMEAEGRSLATPGDIFACHSFGKVYF